jgi:hypothetical protein
MLRGWPSPSVKITSPNRQFEYLLHEISAGADVISNRAGVQSSEFSVSS